LNNEDQRCCGRGVCIINEHGQCWCGQAWDGEKMITAKLVPSNLLKTKDQSSSPEENS